MKLLLFYIFSLSLIFNTPSISMERQQKQERQLTSEEERQANIESVKAILILGCFFRLIYQMVNFRENIIEISALISALTAAVADDKGFFNTSNFNRSIVYLREPIRNSALAIAILLFSYIAHNSFQ